MWRPLRRTFCSQQVPGVPGRLAKQIVDDKKLEIQVAGELEVEVLRPVVRPLDLSASDGWTRKSNFLQAPADSSIDRRRNSIGPDEHGCTEIEQRRRKLDVHPCQGAGLAEIVGQVGAVLRKRTHRGRGGRLRRRHPVSKKELVPVDRHPALPSTQEERRVLVVDGRPSFRDLSVVVDEALGAADHFPAAVADTKAQLDVFVAVHVRLIEPAAIDEQLPVDQQAGSGDGLVLAFVVDGG